MFVFIFWTTAEFYFAIHFEKPDMLKGQLWQKDLNIFGSHLLKNLNFLDKFHLQNYYCYFFVFWYLVNLIKRV